MKGKHGAPVALRYVGEGAYLPFVPARDLSVGEAAQHWAIIKEAEANEQRLYVPAEQVGEEGKEE
jgi:hypothetical protein